MEDLCRLLDLLRILKVYCKKGYEERENLPFLLMIIWSTYVINLQNIISVVMYRYMQLKFALSSL